MKSKHWHGLKNLVLEFQEGTGGKPRECYGTFKETRKNSEC